MANTIDKKVVELELKNSQFNRASEQSINTLDKLKEALKFEKAKDSFEQLEKNIKKVDFSPMNDGIQKVSNQFNALNTVADAVLRNITNKVVQTGERMVSSLTVDQISSGWQQYAERTSAVQRIMSATSQQFSNTEEQMAAVNAQLDKLIWFTDETSFKFNDMVNTIGKFTANNIDLETSVRAMEGISTWAALSGANINEAGRAMYNLAQALSIGAVKTMDWRSIQNANMDTTEFRNTAIEAALAAKTLTKRLDGLYQVGNKTFSRETLFSEGLAQNWFTSGVLISTLDAYGAFSDMLNEFVDETGMMTTTALHFVDQYIDGTLDMKKVSEDFDIEIEDLTKWMEKLGSDEMELGRKGLKAAQETKTFAEAIDFVKTAVSSGWAKSFEHIFGDYTEAKEWWSEVSEYLYDMFVVGGEVRNQMLSIWKETGGRDMFLDGIRDIIEAIQDVIDLVNEAWGAIFPNDAESKSNWLITITAKFREFAANLRLTEDSAEELTTIFMGLFNAVKVVKDVVVSFLTALSPIGHALNLIAGAIVHILSSISSQSIVNSNSLFNKSNLTKLYELFYKLSTVVANLLIKSFEGLYLIGAKVSSVIESISSHFNSGEKGILGFANAIGSYFEELYGNLKESGKTTNGYVSLLGSALGVIGNIIKNLSGFVGSFLDSLYVAEGEANGVLNAVAKTIGTVMKGIATVMNSLTVQDIKAIGTIAALGWVALNIGNFFRSLTWVSDNLYEISKQIKRNSSFGSIIEQLNTLANKTMIIQIGLSIALLVSALNTLSNIDTIKLGVAIVALTGVSLGLLKIMKMIGASVETAPPGKMALFGLAMLELSVALRIIASSVSIFSKIDLNQLVIGVIGLASSLIIVSQFVNSAKSMNVKDILIAAGGLSALAVAISMMIIPFSALSLLPLTNIASATVALSAILLVLRTFMVSLKELDVKSVFAATGSMNLLSLSVISMSTAVISLSSLSWQQMIIGITSFIAIMATLTLVAKSFSNVNEKSISAASISIGALAGSISVVAKAVKLLGSLDASAFEQGISGLTALSIVITLVIGILGTLSKTIEKSNLVYMATSLLTVSGALVAFAVAMRVMEGVSWSTIGMGMVVFAGALAGVIAAAFAIKALNLGPALATLSASLLSLSLNIIVVAAAFWIIIDAFSKLTTGIIALGVTAVAFGEDFPAVIASGIAALTEIFRGILLMIVELGPEIMMAITTIIGAIQGAIWMSKHKMVAMVLTIGYSIITALAELGEPLVEAIIKILHTLTTNLPRLMAELAYFITELFAGIGILIDAAVRGLIVGISNLFGTEGVKEANKIREDGRLIGEAYVNGMADAVEDGRERAEEVAEALGESTADGLNKGLGNDANGHSSEGEKAGKYVTETFINEFGQEETIVKARVAAKELGEETTEALNDSVEKGMDEVEGTVEEGGTTHADVYENAVETELEHQTPSVGNALQNMWNGALGSVDFSIPQLQGIGGLFGGTSTNQTNNTILEQMEKQARYDQKSLYEYMLTLDDVSSEILNKALAQRKITGNQWNILRRNFGYIKTKTVEEGTKTGEDTADAFLGGLGSGLDAGGSSGKLSSAVNKQADTIATVYSNAVKKINFDRTTRELQYKLWQSMNPNAADAEKTLKENQDLLDQVDTQLQIMNEAQKQYDSYVSAFGESSEKALESQQTLLKEQTKFYELQNKLQESNSKAVDNETEAFNLATQKLRDSWWMVEKGMFTKEDIWKEIVNEFGLNYMYDSESKYSNAVKGFIGNAADTAESVAAAMREKQIRELTNLLMVATNAGHDFARCYAEAVVDGKMDLQMAIDVLSDHVRAAMESSKAIKDAEDWGAMLAVGAEGGVEKNADKPVDAVKDMDEEIISESRKLLGIASPSQVFYNMGEMIIEGLRQALENGRSTIVRTIVGIVRDAIDAARAAAGIHSPSDEMYEVGRYFDLGLAYGILGYSNKVQSASNNLIEGALKTVQDNSEEVHSELRKLFDMDDELYLRVVVDADVTKARDSISALEAMQTKSGYFPGGSFRKTNSAFSSNYTNTILQDIYSKLDMLATEQKFPSISSSSEPAVVNNNFTQNNYSPKAISRVDTYRQTQRQFQQFTNRFDRMKR